MKLEGKNAILEALSAGIKINQVFLSDSNSGDSVSIIKQLNEKKIPFTVTGKQALDKMSATGHHQGYIGLMDDYVYATVDDILKKANSQNEDVFLVILDKIEDPHNLGSIIRTAECAGVHGVIIPKNNACTVNETVVRTSAGSVNHMLVSRVTNINQTINELKEKGVFCFALEAGGTLLYQTNLKGKIALVVGSEGFGVSHLVKENCDGIISLPMVGKLNSLNASVAGALGIYEALKQRKF